MQMFQPIINQIFITLKLELTVMNLLYEILFSYTNERNLLAVIIYLLFTLNDPCPTVFNLYRGFIFVHVITMGLVLIKGLVLRIPRMFLEFNKNNKDDLGIIFIFIQKGKAHNSIRETMCSIYVKTKLKEYKFSILFFLNQN